MSFYDYATPKPWTDDETATITKLWHEGHSAGIIGRKVGRSRNSVIGRIFRLGLMRKLPAAPPKVTIPYPKRASAPRKLSHRPKSSPQALVFGPGFSPDIKPPTPMRALQPVEAASAPRPLTERTSGQCAYIVSPDGAETLYCCAPADPASRHRNYCPSHRSLMVSPKKVTSEKDLLRSLRRYA